jgi:FtsP/CotA-like multicopper oxidase with cupredoxin domain
MNVASLTRRKLLAGVPALGLGAAALHTSVPHPHPGGATAQAAEHEPTTGHGSGAGGHAGFRGGEVDHAANGFDPHAIIRDFDYGRTSRLPDGRTLREWTVSASEKEIEIAPGVKFLAWAFNGRVPGPTFRAKEGERLRIRFVNGGRHPHSMHFHGIHPAAMDGIVEIAPGSQTIYEFDAAPAGLHLYHCHVRPLAEHIAKGLYGAFIIDPKDERSKADELVMVMNGFDTNFDRANEVYAANTIGFAYVDRPIRVKRDQLVRLYLVNILEYDLINSFHLHGNFFEYFPTGTSREPSEFTDTVMMCQGQRGILEMRFPNTGKFMFHAHQSEFTELGWAGFFEVVD